MGTFSTFLSDVRVGFLQTKETQFKAARQIPIWASCTTIEFATGIQKNTRRIVPDWRPKLFVPDSECTVRFF